MDNFKIPKRNQNPDLLYYLKCPVFNKKIMRYAKKQESLILGQEKRKATNTACEKTQM